MEFTDPTTRRDAIKVVGLTVSLGALIAACGENLGGSDAAGRVGNAPVVTDPPNYDVDDVVLLRTAASVEFTAVALYERALSLDGTVPEDMVERFGRLRDDHEQTAQEMVRLTTAAGGEAWTCPNPWFTERLVEPVTGSIFSPILGQILDGSGAGRLQVLGQEFGIDDEVVTPTGQALALDSDIESDGAEVRVDGEPAGPGDEVEFARPDDEIRLDVVTFATALENLAAATHQRFAADRRTGQEARVAHATAAALSSRHAAVLAIASNGTDGYLSPTLVGNEVAPDELGQFRQYAISATFGQTSQIEIKAGPGDVNNVRTSYILQTPAENSWVYRELSCNA